VDIGREPGQDLWMVATMTALTVSPERRQSPRTTVNRLAYINLESNNGAIVLNVSNGGLCFHAVDPVQRNGTIRFWFLDHNHQIEADGKLAWMDETQKTGGLRFTTLSAEARLQIRDWISPSATPPAAGRKSVPATPPPSELQAVNASRPNRYAVSDSSVPLEVRSPNTKAPALLRGFSGGLVFGILVSALVAAAFLLHTYRREVGKSLIQLGERLGARYQPPTMSPASNTVLLSAPKVTPLQEKTTTQPLTKTVRPQQAKIEPPPSVSATRAPAITGGATVKAPAISSQPPPTPSSTTSIELDANHTSDKIGTVTEVGSASHPTAHAEDSSEETERSSSTRFLEVGKFHDAISADQTTDKIRQLGFHTIVIHRGHLWMNSYQVLVGPYGSEAEAEAAQENLLSRGFKPRSYERGLRTFTFFSELTVNGTHLPVGDFVISWESYVPDAIVKFEKEGSVIGTTEGKWIRRGVKYEDDAVVYRKNPDGSRTLLEIRFAGMRQVLVFGKSS
jgi:cell division protein FtsN